MTAAQVPEPTAEQTQWALDLVAEWMNDDSRADETTGEFVARVIAAAVAAERAKYVELANRWETFTEGAGIWEPETAGPFREATDELREVIEQ